MGKKMAPMKLRRRFGKVARKVSVDRSKVDQEALILENREAAHKIAASFLRKWSFKMDQDEMTSLADLALCEAASRYAGPAYSKFTTYLYLYIKGELIRALTKELSPDSVQKAVEMNSAMDLNGESGIQIACESRESNPEQNAEAGELRGRFEQAFVALNSLEKKIIFHVYVNESKVASVARNLGYSRGHVSDMRRRALNKIRVHMDDYREAA